MKKAAIVILLSLNFLPLSLLAIRANFYYSTVCVGTETTLISTTTPADSIYRLMWDLDGDGNFDDAVGEMVNILFSYPGAYNIGLKAIALNGDQDAIYKSVPVASLQAAFSLDYSCLNLPVHFYDQTIVIQDTISQYLWKFGDGVQSNQINPTHNYALAGEYTVRLTVESKSGCIDSANNIVTMTNPPVVDVSFSGDTVFPEGDSVVATIVGVYDSVFWSTGQKTNSIVIYETGDYFVRGYLNGCYGERFFSVLSIADTVVRIMTLITPNGDGFNDRWEIINLSEIEPCEVEIFNRWGQKVFSASPYSNDWDGTDNGRPLSNDTYYYFLRCKDGNLQTGTINIVR